MPEKKRPVLISHASSPPIQLPELWPMYYPQWLIAPTEVVHAAALKKFPTQADIFPFCKYVVAELTPYLCQILRADLRILRMTDLVESYLISNCRDSAMRFELMQQIRVSSEWQSLAEQSTIKPPPTESETPAEASEPAAKSEPVKTHRELVDDYIAEVFEKTGRSINREEIWRKAKYQRPREFEYWQFQDPKRKQNRTAHQRFMNLLTVEKPHLK